MSGQTFEDLLAEIAAKPPTDAQLARALRRLEDRFTLLGRAAGMPQFGQELSRQLVDVAEALEARDAPKPAPVVEVAPALSDEEAFARAKALGVQIFWSMGRACWAPAGVAVSGNISGKGWRTSYESLADAARAAVAELEPG